VATNYLKGSPSQTRMHRVVNPRRQRIVMNVSQHALGGALRPAYIEPLRKRMMGIPRAGSRWMTTLHEQSVV
jgi:hypothetical protein